MPCCLLLVLLMQITPATALEDVYRTLQPTPLETPEELQAFYQPAINETRGGDKMQRLHLRLGRAARDGVPFKACVMGHRGVGKSTELSRLIQQVKESFNPIRFSATTALDPGNFRPLDVVLLMMAEVAEHTAKPIDKGGTEKPPSEARLKDIWNWFASEEITRTQAQEMTASLEAGAGVEKDSLWAKVIGLFATLKGEIKYASTRQATLVEYRLTRLTSLIDVANKLLDECNQKLKETCGKQWLFVGEDFDKAGITTDRIEELFITYANIFQDLRTHLIFNLPIGLYYSDKALRLPFTGDCSFVIPDTPVYHQDHSANAIGRDALVKVLEARMSLDLFEPNQMTRLIVASGGNLRDLFTLVNYAADTALLREASQINTTDVNGAIVNLRSDYERRLGQSPFDRETITYNQKATRLVEVYQGDNDAKVPDGVMYSLLNARAIQEFNDKRWFGVHPLVVDILADQDRLSPNLAGEVVGGTV